MNKEAKRATKKYVKAILKELNCRIALKNVLRQKLNEDINAYAEGKENITIEDLCLEFGNPKDMATSMLNKEDYLEELTRSQKKIYSLLIIIVTITIVIIFLVAFIKHILDIYYSDISIGAVTITYSN